MTLVARYATPAAGLLLMAAFALASPMFATVPNLLNVLKDTAVLGLLATGFSLALLVGELDLSVAELCSLAAVVTGALVAGGEPPWVAAAAGLGAGLVGGMINGLCVTALHVPSLIATLGTAAVARGAAFWMTGGVAFVGRWPAGFTSLGRGALGGVPNIVLWLAAVGALAWAAVNHTRPGAHMLATGEAPEPARLAGIPVARVRLLGLTLSGGLAGLGAVLLAASLSSASPGMAGDDFLYAIAAVLLGMTCFEPGRPNIPGTLTACLLLKVLGNGLVLVGWPYFAQDIALGVVIVGSAALSGTALRQAAFR